MNASTQVYGIIGWPVEHSRSPDMHNAAFHALSINATYVAFPTPPAHLPHAIQGLRALGIAGVNITVPHKTHVLKLLDSVHDDALRIGAVNTVVHRDGVLHGTNTDAPGLVRSLQSQSVSLHGRRAVIIGAGGSARAALVGLARAGVCTLGVAARRAEQSASLVHQLAPHLPSVTLHTIEWERAALQAEFEQTDVLVHTTSATLNDAPEGRALAAFLPIDALPPTATVTDLVYRPRVTAVLQAAARRGLHTVDGLGMLLYQGALAFELWTGVEPPIEIMREVLERP
jgi:shikimate dehydrogenase